jgi:hypothetical protein
VAPGGLFAATVSAREGWAGLVEAAELFVAGTSGG